MYKPLLTITGPSGSGKTEVLNRLCKSHGFSKLVSVTTRPPRPGEVDGIDYYFITKVAFDLLKSGGQLAQSVEFNGSCYGTTLEEIERVFEDGCIPSVIVEPTGVGQFKRICNVHHYSLKSVYIEADAEVLIERYIGRLVGETFTKESASYHAKRLSAIAREVTTWPDLADYDRCWYNSGDNIEELDKLSTQIADFTRGNPSW